MAIVTLCLAEVKEETMDRPKGCSDCGSTLLQGLGTVPKLLRDPQHQKVQVLRCH